MYYDSLLCLEGSSASNFHIISGSTLPSGTIGELFFKTGIDEGLYVHDGTEWKLSGTGGSSITDISYYLSFFVPGKFINGDETVAGVIAAQAVTLPQGLSLSKAKCVVPPQDDQTLPILINNIQVGSVTFLANNVNGTFTFSLATTLNAGEIISIKTPTVVDPEIKDVFITLRGTAPIS